MTQYGKINGFCPPPNSNTSGEAKLPTNTTSTNVFDFKIPGVDNMLNTDKFISDNILKDLEKLIQDIEKSDSWFSGHKSYYDKYDLNSNIINSIEDLLIDSVSWNPKRFFDSIFDKQIQMLQAAECNQRIVVAKPLKYAGVTTAFAAFAYHFARSKPDREILFISKHDFDLRKVYNIISRFCEPGIARDKNIITLTNGSRIRFASEESPLDLVAMKIDLAIIDDANELVNIQNTMNNVIMQMAPQGKIAATKWKEFAFVGWYEV